MDLDKSQIQAAMNAAYDRYRDAEKAGTSWTKEQFMEQLSAKEAFAVRIGNMNYQIGNGGWTQWWDNSYASQPTVQALREYARSIANFEHAEGREGAEAEKVLRLLTQFDKMIAGNYQPYSNRSTWTAEDEEEFYAQMEGADLDKQYYAVDDAWLEAAERYLIATFK